MEATIQRDPYEVLIRKIGYSVGLEATRDRARDLVDEYVRTNGVTATQWSDLVQQRWNLGTDHIGKVFAELNLLRVTAGTSDILFGLDALAILRRLLAPARFEGALDAVITALILIADADVFLNCLAANFQPTAVEPMLLAMIRDKRADAYKAIKLSALREKLDRVINIEAQKSNKGGALAGKGLDGLKRTASLDTKERPLSPPKDSEPTISDDYLRKVPARRRDWARSLNLFGEGNATPRGLALLAELDRRGCRYGDGAYSIWPFEPELARLHLTPETAPWTTLTFSGMVEALEGVFLGALRDADGASDSGEVWLRNVFDEYRGLNTQKSMLRNELPLRVAYLVQLGTNVAEGTSLSIDSMLQGFLIAGSSAQIQLRTSRNHEGSIVFKAR
jgi:hypothetical protein